MDARISAGLLLLTLAGCGGDASGANRKTNYGDPPVPPAALPDSAPVNSLKLWDAAAEQTVKEHKNITDYRLAPAVNKYIPANKSAPAAAPKIDAATVPAQPASPKARVGMLEGLAEKRPRAAAWDYFSSISNAQHSISDRLNAGVFRHNMDLYKAEHNNKGPKSHEEMMHILEADWLMKLPEPPKGKKYIYDPADEELYLEEM
jgi:hypothetical protein